MEPYASIQYSIVIPVYNSSKVLGELQQRIEQVFTNRIKQPYEIILVDDGSSNPDTWPAVANLARKDHHTTGIRLTRNFGQHAALFCGLAHARGAYMITMDDDLQHPPEDIPALISLQDHDVVIGQFQQKKHSPLRNLASRSKAYFDRILSGKPQHLRISTFCLIQGSIVAQMLAVRQTPYPFFSALIFQVTRDVVGVPVNHNPRREGKSGYSFFQLGRLFSRLLLNHTGRISQWVAWCGALLFGLSLTVLSGLFIWQLFYPNLPGWLFLGLIILLSNGFILLVLGILGAGISRIIAAAERQKSYLIREKVS